MRRPPVSVGAGRIGWPRLRLSSSRSGRSAPPREWRTTSQRVVRIALVALLAIVTVAAVLRWDPSWPLPVPAALQAPDVHAGHRRRSTHGIDRGSPDSRDSLDPRSSSSRENTANASS